MFFMKQKLLLAAMLLGGSLTASAQWTFPEPETTGFSIVEGTNSTDTLYLYNVGAKAYFTEGNAWGTQASSGTSGLKVYFNKYIPADLAGADSIWDGSTYLIWDFSLAKNEWRNLFIDSETNMFVDHGSQGSDCWMFSVETNGSTFRILPGVTNGYNAATLGYKGYVGITEDLEGNIAATMSPLLAPEDIDATQFKAYHVDWAFVTKEAYEKQQALVPAYQAAMALKTEIDKAEAQGIDVSAEKAVFNNTSSTVEQLEAATTSVKEKIAGNLENKYSPTNPYFMDDDFVVNYKFDDTSGWTTTTGAQNTGTAKNKTEEAGRDGNFYFTGTFWENWNPNDFTGKLYKEMTQMPQGVYRLELAAFTTAGNGSYIYLNGDSTEVTYGSPEKYEVITLVEGTDTVEIGLKVVKPAGWVGIDNCHLTYYGNSNASFRYLMAEKAALNTIPTDAYYQKAAKTAYDGVVDATAAPNGADDAVAKLQQLNDAWATFKANLDAYQALNDSLIKGNQVIDAGYESPELSDYLMDVEEMLEDGELSTEEAKNNAIELGQLIVKALQNPPVGREVDLFTNTDFSGAGGWYVDQTTVSNATSSTPQIAGLSINPNGERWNANFDYYQTANGLPNGVYKMTAQAFYRTGSNAAAESGRETDEILAWIYINGTKKAIHNIMDFTRNADELMGAVSQDITGNCYLRTDVTGAEGESVYTPNGQNSASAFFQLGDYQNEVYGIVTDGTLRMGIKSEGTISDRWTLFDNFHVYYMGMDEEVLSQILEEKIANAEEMTESGMAVASKDALSTAITTGNTALSSGDGNTMFKAIQTVDAAIAGAEESVKLYEDLSNELDKLLTALETANEQGTGSPEAFEAADEMGTAIEEARESGSWTNEEVIAKIAETESIIAELKKPADVPTDDNPVDYTSYIENPTFETIGDFTGWKGSSWGAGGTTGPSAERFQMDFDTYQEISVPAGTYKLSVNGYHRAGDAAADWTAYKAQQEALAEDPNYIDPTLTAFLYAHTSEGDYSVALPHASAGWVASPYGIESESQVESEAYIPNTMLAADTYFHTAKVDEQGNEYYPYNVSIIIKVGADQKLRLGVKRNAGGATPGGNWTIVDDFELICYGTESALTPSGDASGVESIATAEPVSVQYFTVGGARANAAQKGINIVKKVNADGTVTVSKVLVK